jgi:hypothetical protein
LSALQHIICESRYYNTYWQELKKLSIKACKEMRETMGNLMCIVWRMTPSKCMLYSITGLHIHSNSKRREA